MITGPKLAKTSIHLVQASMPYNDPDDHNGNTTGLLVLALCMLMLAMAVQATIGHLN